MLIEPDSFHKVETCFLELDSQISELRKILSRFVKTKEGGSCAVTGVGGSGKTSVLKMVVNEYQDKVDVYFIDAYLHSETQASRIYDSDMESYAPRIIVVDRFEQFAMKAKQQLLYRMLDASRSYPWFIICVSSREDCMSMLEKRVRSRLSHHRIRFEYNITKDSYMNGSRSLLLQFGISTKWKQHVDKLLSNTRVQKELENLSYDESGFEPLRKLVVMYCGYLLKWRVTDLPEKASEELFLKCMRLIGHNDEMDTVLEGLNLRELCLLNCLIRLMSRARKIDFSYKQIVTEYKVFTNSHDKMMRVDDVVLYKDLNGLCNSGVLVPDSGSLQGHLEFRRVRLGVEKNDVQQVLEEFSPLPTKVEHWLNDTNVK